MMSLRIFDSQTEIANHHCFTELLCFTNKRVLAFSDIISVKISAPLSFPMTQMLSALCPSEKLETSSLLLPKEGVLVYRGRPVLRGILHLRFHPTFSSLQSFSTNLYLFFTTIIVFRMLSIEINVQSLHHKLFS